MAHAHVPKFGGWDSDNITYTACFEKAHIQKTGEKMNPNPKDPEGNPMAFLMSKKGDGVDDHVHAHNKSSSPTNSQNSIASSEKTRDGERRRQARKPSNQRSVTSESNSDKSNSDFCLLPPSQEHTESNKKKCMTGEGGISSTTRSSFSLSIQGGQAVQKRSTSHPTDVKNHHKSPSVPPKFGAWDEEDPKSGEGFTVIFDKVKKEKEDAAARLPTPSPNIQSKQEKSSFLGSKLFCCLSP
ncbi:putative RPM1 interacting protein 4 [Quillaja saponaria]|uniref:RPM1 interacting protein 4 n=1 Tax=Quillaja saponaria TaxID=32244 RepID=A0AAD7KV20_QUISA|nr:putative RPM1 interacting protein 4 [Quillaja saponaria]